MNTQEALRLADELDESTDGYGTLTSSYSRPREAAAMIRKLVAEIEQLRKQAAMKGTS